MAVDFFAKAGITPKKPDIKGRGYPKASPVKQYVVKNVGFVKTKSGESKSLF
jgi:hypothetical protein